MWLIYNTIQDNAILKPPSKFGGLIGSTDWIIVLTRMMGTDRQTDGQTDRRTDAGDDNNPSAEEAEG